MEVQRAGRGGMNRVSDVLKFVSLSHSLKHFAGGLCLGILVFRFFHLHDFFTTL